MRVQFDVFRKKPDQKESYRQVFEVDVQPGDDVLDVFHRIQEQHDPTFAYRYSCRGAICGSCAVRINGVAALACKTQALPLATSQKTPGAIKIDPLDNVPPIRDLVTDFAPFWEAYEAVRPYIERAQEQHDEQFVWPGPLDARNMDQLNRDIDCIKCAACFSDCPKRGLDQEFIGPQACLQLHKFYFDPRDGSHSWRMDYGLRPEAVFCCDSYANCVRVCPKDCRPLRAINLVKQDLKPKQE